MEFGFSFLTLSLFSSRTDLCGAFRQWATVEKEKKERKAGQGRAGRETGNFSPPIPPTLLCHHHPSPYCHTLYPSSMNPSYQCFRHFYFGLHVGRSTLHFADMFGCIWRWTGPVSPFSFVPGFLHLTLYICLLYILLHTFVVQCHDHLLLTLQPCVTCYTHFLCLDCTHSFVFLRHWHSLSHFCAVCCIVHCILQH